MICTIFKSFITSSEYSISSKIPTASLLILINSSNLVSKYAFLLTGGLNCLMLDSYYNRIILGKVFMISNMVFEVKYIILNKPSTYLRRHNVFQYVYRFVKSIFFNFHLIGVHNSIFF